MGAKQASSPSPQLPCLSSLGGFPSVHTSFRSGVPPPPPPQLLGAQAREGSHLA